MKNPGMDHENKKSVDADQEIYVRLVNDEPVDSDELGRTEAITGLVAAIKNCETPFVMAINGGWGSGKTSLLKCLEKKIKKHGGEKFRTVWFSPWKFQFEESPAVSLLQHIRRTAVEEKWISKIKVRRKTMKLLNIAGTLAGEIALKITTGHAISTRDILNQGAAFEEKYFEAKQLTSRMQEEFEKAVNDLLVKGGRLVLFIDDLDRCRTENALRLLEALKLFLNARNCVYVLAIDITNLNKNLENVERGVKNPGEYLDKIFQLIYTLPSPDADQEYKYIRSLLESDHICPFKKIKRKDEILTRIALDLAKFMADNPRALKQFCNRFCLESAILKKMVDNYDPVRHIFLQFLQHCFPIAYKLFYSRRRIQVLQRSKKYFDKFIWDWAAYLAGYDPDNYHSAEIDPKHYEQYFPHLPYSPVQRSLLENKDRFVRITLNNGTEAVVCIEALPENLKIPVDANLSDTTDLWGTILRDLNLSDCRLYRCNFDRVVFEGTDLSSADCFYSTFKDARFAGVIARKTNFSNADLTGLIYDGADFTDAVFNDTELSKKLKTYIASFSEPVKHGKKKTTKRNKK